MKHLFGCCLGVLLYPIWLRWRRGAGAGRYGGNGSHGGPLNTTASKILMNLLIHIMHMLLQLHDVSQADRMKLVELTAQLQAAMDEGKPARPRTRGK